MECNKEEAIRAKEIAEKKMQNKDFSGARKIALKAQQLYPDLENISQLLMVCDVHLSAESKAYGNNKNWYDILKIEPTADDISIKKQYRKFALLLHPDKNNFAGATDAFKLIGEAQRVLLDREKRRVHDLNIKNFRPNGAPSQQQARTNTNARAQPWGQNPFMGRTTSPFTSFNPQQQQPPKNPQQQQQPPKAPQSTFWTMCPYCTVKYQYYREIVNKNVFCQRCKKSFTGHEIKDQAIPNQPPWTQPKPGVSNPINGAKVGPQINPSFKPQARAQARASVAKSGISEVGNDSKAVPTFSAKVNGKRKMRIDESSESEDTDSSSESEEEDVIEENGDVKARKGFGCVGENLRRSSRSKTNISYKENLSDDDDDLGRSSKKAKPSGSFDNEAPSTSKFDGSSKPLEDDDLDKVKSKETVKIKDCSSPMKNGRKVSVEANGEISDDSSPDRATDSEIYDYPDPDFNDFDINRRGDCFAVGQIWAVYDTLDGMPRFYARITRIVSTSVFKVRITWLEPDPDDEDGIKWVGAGLPMSCGELTKGDTETTDNQLMFSHQIEWEKGSKRDTFKIYPRKGETWALFRKWDMNWLLDPESKRKYELEFVEILSEYNEDDGVTVAYLGKVKGFSCLFCKTARGGVDLFKIPPNQLLRFSHRVPSFRLTGDEADNVPKNSFELDPASLPPKLDEIDIPKEQRVEVETVVLSDEDSDVHEVENEMEIDSKGKSNSSKESPEAYEIPEPEFFNFDGEKSEEKFQPGQFWAIYSDEDGLPKYYAFIRKIDHRPVFKLHVTWLSACLAKNTIKYADKNIPITCGAFKYSPKSETSSYTDTRTFSHRIKVEPTNQKNEFGIYPKKREVWAVYRNWNVKMSRSDLKKCEYDLVEILEETDFAIKVVPLERISGYNSVFKACRNKGSLVVVEILRSELLKFSHQIPAFRLMDQREGALKGFWELDPAALPLKMFHTG